jgi:lauroyl/myristoyl acyltransferase
MLSTLLRRGNCTLVLFCDVSAECGARTAVRFLGRQAWFSRGPATLAVINRVPLVPVLCTNDANQSWIDITSPLDPVPHADESVRDCVDRLTQQLVSHFEDYFRASPEQWRYLHQLPLYFTNMHPTPDQG